MPKANQTLTVGLIGCGRVVVNRHLPTLATLPNVKVVALADCSRERLKSVGDAFHITARYADYTELLQKSEVEAVGVCVPLELHAQVGSAVMDAGKHLLLEKPLAMTLDEADMLVDQASRTDLKCMLGFNKRWHRLVRQAKEIIDAGHLGPVRLVNMVFATGHHDRAIPDWRKHRSAGGGNLLENAPHLFDLSHYLLGPGSEEVTATVGAMAGHDDEPAIVTVRRADNVFVNCVLSDLLPDESRLDIFGRDGLLRVSLHRFDGLEMIPLHSYAGGMNIRLRGIWRFLSALPSAVWHRSRGSDYVASFRSQWEHFVDCIQYDRPVQCTFEDGRKALEVTLAAVESASSGRPVKISDGVRRIAPVC